MDSLYAQAGGEENLRRMVAAWYPKVMADPLVAGLFRNTTTAHVDALTAFLAEVLGGPRRFSEAMGGYDTLFDAHRKLSISEDQRERFVALFTEAATETGVCVSPRQLRDAFLLHLEFGTEIAKAAPLRRPKVNR